MNANQLKEAALAVVKLEAVAIKNLASRINKDFVAACDLVMQCKGRVIVTGMGKSGHIGGKIAATLASTGTPSFFVHPGEASHGDLGMITADDIVIAISNSGETDEILTIVPIIRRLNVPLISMTGNSASSLAKHAEINLDVSVDKEACPLNLAPTSSTTATLVMGDALAVGLLQYRDFTADDFARSHPGGKLGKRLLLQVSDIMHSGTALPLVSASTLIKDALLEISKKGLGFCMIVDDESLLSGLYTDGDLRRSLDEKVDIHTTEMAEVMVTNYSTITPEALVVEALNLMEEKKITSLPVVDDANQVTGALHMHDLLRAGVV